MADINVPPRPGRPASDRSPPPPQHIDGPLEPEDLPDPAANLPGIVIYSHSRLLYWWPVWAVGFALAAVSYMFGRGFATDDGRVEWIHPNTGVGITFIVVLLLVILVTNVSLRGIYSVTAIVSLAFLVVLFAWIDGSTTSLARFPICLSSSVPAST